MFLTLTETVKVPSGLTVEGIERSEYSKVEYESPWPVDEERWRQTNDGEIEAVGA